MALRSKRRLTLTDFGKAAALLETREQAVVRWLAERPDCSRSTLVRQHGLHERWIDDLIQRGVLAERVSETLSSTAAPKRVTRYRWLGGGGEDRLTLALRDKMKRLAATLGTFGEGATRSQILDMHPDCGYALTRALSLGWVEKFAVEYVREPSEPLAPLAETVPELTPAQRRVVAQVLEAGFSRRFHAHLVHGVTGSGKTEVYMRLAAEALSQGRGALFLVPEISLTPQLVRRLRGRFGNQVAVLRRTHRPVAGDRLGGASPGGRGAIGGLRADRPPRFGGGG
jgi:primosomal protein N'